MGDVLEEADESGFWIELPVDSGKVGSQTATPLLSRRRNCRYRYLIDQYGKAKLRGARIIAIPAEKMWAGRDYALCTLHFAFESFPAHAISTKNKHLLLSCDTNPRFTVVLRCLGHTSCEALKM